MSSSDKKTIQTRSPNREIDPPPGYAVQAYSEHVSGPIAREAWRPIAVMPCTWSAARSEAVAACWAHRNASVAPLESDVAALMEQGRVLAAGQRRLVEVCDAAEARAKGAEVSLEAALRREAEAEARAREAERALESEQELRWADKRSAAQERAAAVTLIEAARQAGREECAAAVIDLLLHPPGYVGEGSPLWTVIREEVVPALRRGAHLERLPAPAPKSTEPAPPDGSGEPWDGDGWYTRREEEFDAPARAPRIRRGEHVAARVPAPAQAREDAPTPSSLWRARQAGWEQGRVDGLLAMADQLETWITRQESVGYHDNAVCAVRVAVEKVRNAASRPAAPPDPAGREVGRREGLRQAGEYVRQAAYISGLEHLPAMARDIEALAPVPKSTEPEPSAGRCVTCRMEVPVADVVAVGNAVSGYGVRHSSCPAPEDPHMGGTPELKRCADDSGACITPERCTENGACTLGAPEPLVAPTRIEATMGGERVVLVDWSKVRAAEDANLAAAAPAEPEATSAPQMPKDPAAFLRLFINASTSPWKPKPGEVAHAHACLDALLAGSTTAPNGDGQ